MNLSIRDAASMLDVSEETVYGWARANEIPCTKINDQYRFDRMTLLEWATTRQMKVSPTLLVETAEGEMPSFADSLEAGGIFYEIAGDDVSSVLGSVVDHLRLPDSVDREYLYEIMLARELSHSTGVGGGIAVPHPRTPIVLPIPIPTVTLCFLAKPVDFNAIDSKPVDTLFTVVGATVKAHLHLLSRLAYCLHDSVVKELLARKAAPEELFRAFRAAENAIPTPGGKT